MTKVTRVRHHCVKTATSSAKLTIMASPSFPESVEAFVYMIGGTQPSERGTTVHRYHIASTISTTEYTQQISEEQERDIFTPVEDAGESTEQNTQQSGTTTEAAAGQTEQADSFDFSLVPEYSGSPYIEINNNTPYFTPDEIAEAQNNYEYYSELDDLGRCGVCIASIGQDIMPTEERGEIGQIKPTGWHTVKYPDIISDLYLYNRCHLIGYQLFGRECEREKPYHGNEVSQHRRYAAV